MRRKLVWALSGLLWGVSAWAARPQEGLAPIRVGFICPFTGGSADFGTAARLGAELAVSEINQAGGYLGRPLELVARDDKSNPDEGRKIAEELVQGKKADFTIGFCNSGVALKSLEVFQNAHHLLMIPVATATALTSQFPPASSFIFRVSPRDALQAAFLVDEVQRRGLSKVAVFADKTGYGEGGLKDVERFLAQKGLKPVYVARFDLGTANLTAQMREAKAAGAEALIAYTVGPEMGMLAQSRAEAGVSADLLGSWTLALRSAEERGGKALEGAAMAQTIVPDTTLERRTSFIARLHRLRGKEPLGSLMAAAQSYDAVYLMLGALFQAQGRTDGEALKNALEHLNRPYSGVVTTYDQPFSPSDHDAISANMLWLATWRRGDLHFYYPEDARKATVIQRKPGAAH
uniref:ABC transporter substrate-binding protein n=1 Tax=Ideonella sp. B508-1 TaxID=137716 RepID=UPI0003B459EE|nr:ABC transporter substrate-binding protein [Ideonella sp. B508-1]